MLMQDDAANSLPEGSVFFQLDARNGGAIVGFGLYHGFRVEI